MVSKVKQGFADMDQLASRGPEGYEQLSEIFQLCSPIENDTDYKQLLYTIRNAFVTMTMFDYPYPVNFGSPLPPWPVNYSSSVIMQADTPMKGLLGALNIVYNDSSLPCFDPYVLYIACADPTGCGLGNDAKAWDFQVCYELNLGLNKLMTKNAVI